MTRGTNGLAIERGSEVVAKGRRFVITHVLDLDAVMAQDPATGLSERLLIEDLRPADSENEPDVATPDLSQLDGKDWDEARRRLALIKPFLEQSRTVRSEVEQAAAAFGVEASTVYRWMRHYRATGKLSSLLPMRPSGGRGKPRIQTNAEEIVSLAIENYHLTAQQPSVRATAIEVERLCRAAGISPPHQNTIRARINAHSERERLRRRGHAKAASDRFEARPGEFDAAIRPLSLVQLDHTLLNVMLVDEEERRPIGRPWLTLACDIFSRMVPGFAVSLDPPGASSSGLCLTHAILPKETWLAKRGIGNKWPCWGIPAIVHMDNAREFHGEMLRRACEQYGIEIDFRMLAKPHYGSHIERLMGTLSTALETLEGATFSSPSKRGEYGSENLATMTLLEFETWFAEYITGVYHQRFHEGIKMSPLQRWRDAILGTNDQPAVGIMKRPVDEDRIRLDFMPYIERTIQQYGVQADDIQYYSDVLRRHINATSRNGKRKFVFRRDPRDISVIYFWDPDLKQYAEVPYRNTTHPPMSLWELRAIRRDLVQQGRANIDEDAIFEAYERLRSHQEQAAKSTKKVRRAKERRKASARRERVQLPAQVTVDLDLPTNIEPFDIYDV
ncbi:MAG: transposase [Vulcanimicrobiaceae bacterium]